MRTIKRESFILNTIKYYKLEKLCYAYAHEKQYWLSILQSWRYQALLGVPRIIRDEFVKQKYQSKYGLQARHWKLALQDAIETWDKYWQALFLQVKHKIKCSKVLSEQGRRYAYWLLINYVQFSALMKGGEPKPNFEIEDRERHRVACYVRKIIRKLKTKQPKVRKTRICKFDSNCYELFENNGQQYLKLMSLEKGKRIIIPLKGKTKIEGTITIVLGKVGIAVHVSQDLKPVYKSMTSVEAVDFGYTEVMTDTQGIRYGQKLGQLLTTTSNKRHEKMQKRHKLHALKQKYNKSKPHKAVRLRKYNLERKKLNITTGKGKATIECEINKGINELIKTRKPGVLITENLRNIFTYKKSKSMNRRLSSWTRGKLQDRVYFKAKAEGFRHEQVNPAYGSQTCPMCDFVDQGNRKLDKFKCLHCGHENQADRIAALNYARRYGDCEIGQYVPYSQIKTILLSRFHRRLEAGIPATVPGRTLETVIDVYPQQSIETNNVLTVKEN